MDEDKKTCAECGREVGPEKVVYIDDSPYCPRCMYGELEPFEIYPIGFVRNALDRKPDREFGLVGDRKEESRIKLLPSQKRFLYKLEEEEYLTIIFYLHKRRPPRTKFKRGMDGKEVGTFASRSPDRLSGLAVTDVKLNGIEGLTLFVSGLDAINGTPVLDIKMSSGDRRKKKSS
ncbi:MAG: SAM-dependent methyltransferase [Deltaproteobacteria bacterium]|nr:SAM-dependent methyltransferase [Deltaproteobacteria bacterium]